MIIDEEIDEYPELSCTCENQNMHRNDQNGSECVPGQRATMRYQEMGLVHNEWR